MKTLIALLWLLCIFSCQASEALKPAKSKTVPIDGAPENRFVTKHIWDAKVDIGEVLELGASKYGTRRTIPISGGTFNGPNISGTVLPGGADWQVTRADGDTELNARYLLKTNDGVLIHIINRALIHTPVVDGKAGEPYIRSVLELEAPVNSRYDYLNHAIFLGTLEIPQLKPGENPYVIIGVHQLL
jgi:hypothetical protein